MKWWEIGNVDGIMFDLEGFFDMAVKGAWAIVSLSAAVITARVAWEFLFNIF